MGVCSTRHWETPGRQVQELNVCTVLQRGEPFEAELETGFIRQHTFAALFSYLCFETRKSKETLGLQRNVQCRHLIPALNAWSAQA